MAAGTPQPPEPRRPPDGPPEVISPEVTGPAADTPTEYLAKLRTIADGALAAIDREKTEARKWRPIFTDAERRQNWWDGYREAIDVMADFLAKQETTK